MFILLASALKLLFSSSFALSFVFLLSFKAAVQDFDVEPLPNDFDVEEAVELIPALPADE